MPKLIFNSDDVRRVVEHSISAKSQGKKLVDYVDGKPVTVSVGSPSVLLVHDQGVYLMSNGQPRDIVAPDASDRKDEANNEGRSFCAYAQGCDPDKDADWWETSRALVGGDDFGECLPWAGDMKAIIDAGRTVCVEITDTNLELKSE